MVMQLVGAAIVVVVAVVIARVSSAMVPQSNVSMGAGMEPETGVAAISAISAWTKVIAIVASAGLAMHYLLGTFASFEDGHRHSSDKQVTFEIPAWLKPYTDRVYRFVVYVVKRVIGT